LEEKRTHLVQEHSIETGPLDSLVELGVVEAERETAEKKGGQLE